MRIFIIVLLMLATTLAMAAPREVEVVYHATRNGQPFAKITETFSQENGRYRIESLTEGIGVYALFGKRRLLSEGEVTEQGLKPLHFEQQQGNDSRRRIVANFDWANNTLNMQVKGKAKTAALEPGAQDILSFAYQFMFAPPQGEQVVMQVTTGKRLRAYRYQIEGRDIPVESEAGIFKTVHLIEAGDEKDTKELWLSPEQHYLPVRIVVDDEDNGKIEQAVARVNAR